MRELRNAIERACILAEGATISERELSGSIGHDSGPARPRASEPASFRTSEPPAALGDLEREHIVDVLKQLSGNRMAAARVLGISRRALYRRLERHHIEDAATRPAGRRP